MTPVTNAMALALDLGRNALKAKVLDPSQFSILLAIVAHLDHDECHEPAKTLAEEAGVSESTLTRKRRGLVERGFITFAPGKRLPDGTQSINTYYLGSRFSPLPLKTHRSINAASQEPSVNLTEPAVILTEDSVEHLNDVYGDGVKDAKATYTPYTMYSVNVTDGDKVEISDDASVARDTMDDPLYDPRRWEQPSFGNLRRPTTEKPEPILRPAASQKMSKDEAQAFFADVEQLMEQEDTEQACVETVLSEPTPDDE